MWPFSCTECPRKDNFIKHAVDTTQNLTQLLRKQNGWKQLADIQPSLHSNILVANKDFTHFGFLYMEDGWDYSRKINMFYKGLIWATYTNPESISWWLNLDLINKEI